MSKKRPIGFLSKPLLYYLLVIHIEMQKIQDKNALEFQNYYGFKI